MRKFALLFALVLGLPLWAADEPFAAYEKAVYNIDRETCNVYRVGPNPGYTGPDIDALHKWALARKAKGLSVPPMWGYDRSNIGGRDKTAGTPEKDKGESKAPENGDDKKDQGKPEEKKDAEPDWPPKEVAPAADKGWEPTEAELEQVKSLCLEAKNSGEFKKYDEARTLAWALLRRLAKPGDKLSTAEWAKRFDAADKINQAMKAYRSSYNTGNNDVCNALAEDIATEDKHSAMFAKLKWMYDNQRKYDISSRYFRISTYKYIENHADAFRDAAAKKLFCTQLIKGGVRDKELQDLADSYK